MQEKIKDLEGKEDMFFVESIYGAKTRQGIVQIEWGGVKTQLSILDAKKIAYMILEACRFAQVDEAVFEFFSTLPGPDSMQLAALVIKGIREKQGRNDPRYFES